MPKWHIELDDILDSSFFEPYPFREISSKGIALYGAGDMGKMALDFFKKSGIKPFYIIDKNKSGLLDGIKILNPKDISLDDKKSLTFIVSIATIPLNPIYDFLKNDGFVDIRHFYDLSEILFKDAMSNGWIEEKADKDELEYVLKLLEHDNKSVAHYLQFLWWRLKRKENISSEFPVLCNQKFFKAPCMPKLNENECFLDGGAHHGQSLSSFFKATNHQYEKVWAFEPDNRNISILKENIKNEIDIYGKALHYRCENVAFQDALCYASKVINSGDISVEAVTIDSLNINPTIIKLHIEGGEYNALIGASKTIKDNRPIVMVLADHNKDGLYSIPKYLGDLESYKIYFYLHDYCGNSAVYYAIPNERVIHES
ncbi:MAG: FkbM family methyltransferase [Campylobacterota bacterium]|nr:FkbM family methyltransferase [Campylobacterota bacterium]